MIYSPPLTHVLVPEIEKPATGTHEGTIITRCARKDCDFYAKSRTIFPYKSIELEKSQYAYTGSAIIPSFKVIDIQGRVISPKFYDAEYCNNKKTGTATLHLTFSGMYSGKMTKTFQIVKGKQVISAKASVFRVPKSDVRKKGVTIKLGTKAKTKLTYKSSSNKITVKKGVAKIKKGIKKGTYIITVTAKETKNWKRATRKIKIKIK